MTPQYAGTGTKIRPKICQVKKTQVFRPKFFKNLPSNNIHGHSRIKSTSTITTSPEHVDPDENAGSVSRQSLTPIQPGFIPCVIQENPIALVIETSVMRQSNVVKSLRS